MIQSNCLLINKKQHFNQIKKKQSKLILTNCKQNKKQLNKIQKIKSKITKTLRIQSSN